MNDLEERLVDLLRENTVPESDPLFRVQVLIRRERIHFRQRLLLLAFVSLATAALAASQAPSIGSWLLAHTRPVLSFALTAPLAVTAALAVNRWLASRH